MSYAEIKPEYYRMHQPDSPWHAGAPGWKTAPIPGWGQNPNLVGPPRLAIEGLGADGSGSWFSTMVVLGAIGFGAWWLLATPKAGRGTGHSAVRHSSHKPAARKKRAAPKGRAGKTYRYWADIIDRDLAAGDLTPGEVESSLRQQYDEDEEGFVLDGITSADQFVTGVRAQM